MNSLKKDFKKARLVFAGGSDWSVEFLDFLKKENFSLVGVLTKPDEKKNRGQKIVSNQVKNKALEFGIPVFTPHSLKDPEFVEKFKKIKADLVVVVAYGKIFPPEILAIPSKGFLNFHPSFLPDLRGPSPITTAILKGQKETGVSIMKLGPGMDDGPVLKQQKVKIQASETTQSLTQKLIKIGKKMLVRVLIEYLENNLTPKEQPKKGVTYSKIISKEMGKVNWENDSAREICNKIRAFDGSIRVFSSFLKNGKSKRVNFLVSGGVLKGQNREKMNAGEFEIINQKQKKFLAVKTKKDFLLISNLQVEGKKPISAEEFLVGYGHVQFGR